MTMFQSETLSRMGLSVRGFFNVESDDEDAPLGSAKAEKGRLDVLSAMEEVGMGYQTSWVSKEVALRRDDKTTRFATRQVISTFTTTPFSSDHHLYYMLSKSSHIWFLSATFISTSCSNNFQKWAFLLPLNLFVRTQCQALYTSPSSVLESILFNAFGKQCFHPLWQVNHCQLRSMTSSSMMALVQCPSHSTPWLV